MMEILLTIQNVMDSVVVFGLGLVGAYFILTGIMEITPKNPPKKKISISKTDKNKAA